MASISDKPEPEISQRDIPRRSSRPANCFGFDLFLRLLLIGATISCVVVMIFGKQTLDMPPDLLEYYGIPSDLSASAKFSDSPAYIYFVAALSAAGIYSIITAIASFAALLKPSLSKPYLIILAFWDSLMLGIVASATATEGAVAYIELKGNDNMGWGKVCDVYNKFCRHVGISFGVSLLASILLLFLVFLSTSTLYRQIPKSTTV